MGILFISAVLEILYRKIYNVLQKRGLVAKVLRKRAKALLDQSQCSCGLWWLRNDLSIEIDVWLLLKITVLTKIMETFGAIQDICTLD